MINSKTVKDSFHILLALTRNILILFLIGICGYAAVSWGTRIYPEPVTNSGIIVSFVFQGIQETFAVSVLFGLVLSLLRYRRRPGIRILSLLLLFTAASALLITGTAGIPRIVRAQPVYTLPVTIDDGYIYRRNRESVFITSQNGTELRNVLRMDPAEEPVLSFSADLRISGPVSEIGDHSVQGLNVFEPPVFLGKMFRDIGSLNEVLRTTGLSSLPLLSLTSLSILFCVLAAGLLLSLPKWPLYNGIIILFFLRLFLYLAPFLWQKKFHQILGLFIDDRLLVYAPSAILTFLGLMFLLCIGLLSFGRKKERVKTHG